MRSLRKTENNPYIVNTAIRELQLLVATLAGSTIGGTTTQTIINNITTVASTASSSSSASGSVTSDQANKLITELKVIATLLQIGLNIKDEIQPIRESIEDDDLTVSQ